MITLMLTKDHVSFPSHMHTLTHTHQDERAFSAEEEEKLQAALQLEAKDLELVLDTTSFILQQVQYQELMKLGVPEAPLLHSCLPFVLFLCLVHLVHVTCLGNCKQCNIYVGHHL